MCESCERGHESEEIRGIRFVECEDTAPATMHLPVTNHETVLEEFDDKVAAANYQVADSGSGSGSGEGDSGITSRGNGGCIRDRPVKVLPCPRCQSLNTKFCYYNNYSVNQPRHFCRNCQRYWTVGGTLRNVPVGGGSRKKGRTRGRNDPYLIRSEGTSPSPTASSLPPNPAHSASDLFSVSGCLQQLSSFPPLGAPPMLTFSGALGGGFQVPQQMPFGLQFGVENPAGSLFSGHLQQPKQLSGLQEVPDLQSLYDAPRVPQLPQATNLPAAMVMPSGGSFFLPEVQLEAGEQTYAFASMMAKANLWSSSLPTPQPVQNTNTTTNHFCEDRKASISAQLQQHLSGYEERRNTVSPSLMANATVLPQTLKQPTGFWETVLMHSRSVMDDRLVPHTSWEDIETQIGSHVHLSSNASSSTSEEDRCAPSNGFSQHGLYEDVSRTGSWVGLQASDILGFH